MLLVVATEATSRCNPGARTPHINLFRDPRWGRGSETYGEDPHLTSRMAVSVVHGLQGSSPSGVIKVGSSYVHACCRRT
jgi:beta-glucosidase-like glycosyl hydrolase